MNNCEPRPSLRFIDIASAGNFSKWLMRREVALPSESLADYRPEHNAGGARLVLSPVEGARFVSTDFASEAELVADLEELMNHQASPDTRRE